MADTSLPLTITACNTCRFWDIELSDFADIAACRRNPPAFSALPILGRFPRQDGESVPRYLETTGRGVWPVVSGGSWCGEYRAR